MQINLTLPAEALVYLIADIHSNLPALQAVLKAIPEAAEIICAGDMLGYYTEPNEVCDLLQARGVHCIKGNHDKYVLEEMVYSPDRESKYRIIPNRAALTPQNREWLAALPDVLSILRAGNQGGVHGGGSVYVFHGSPDSVEEYIYPDTEASFPWPPGCTHMVLGHTHHPMRRDEQDGIIINPGSVGQVRDRIPGAAYASLDLQTGTSTFHRASYDIHGYQQILRLAGVVDVMVDMLSRSRT